MKIDEGAAFIYHGSPSGVGANFVTRKTSNQSNCKFGESVSSAGDVNGDGYSDIVIGAKSFSCGLGISGAAFIYIGSSGGIAGISPIRLDPQQNGALFGTSVASAGDVNGDGYSDVIIGATGFDFIKPNVGAAFVYHGSANGIDTSASIILKTNQSYCAFGFSVASAGDINGDGYSDVIIGAPLYNNGEMAEGRAYIYHGTASGITVGTLNLVRESNQAYAQFGYSVASAGDVNGDGYSDIIIGAPYYTLTFPSAPQNEGITFVYHSSNTGLAIDPSSILRCGQSNAHFGWSVASAGDVNGDGYSDIIVGVPLFDQGYTNDEGSALTFLGNNGNSSSGLIRNNTSASNLDLNSNIIKNNMSSGQFGAGQYSKSFLGRSKGKLIWETKRDGQGFSVSTNGFISITNSTQSTGQQSSYTDLSITGTKLKNVLNKVSGSLSTKFRTRVKYSLTTAITGQVYGPWRYATGYVLGVTTHNTSPKMKNEGGGKTTDLRIIAPDVEKTGAVDGVKVFPNPISNICKIESITGVLPAQIEIFDIAGQHVKTVYVNAAQTTVDIDFSDIAAGTYLLRNAVNGVLLSKVVKQ